MRPLSTLPPAHELESAFSAVAASRSAGRQIAPTAFERLMVGLVESGRGVAVYRLMEEAAADGVRYADFSPSTRALLQGLLPPEAEEWQGGASAASPAHSAAPTLISDELPPLWVSPSGSVRSFDCRRGAGRERALAAAWAVVREASAPVLLRGVGADWPACDEWSLALLRTSMERAMVRVSPSSAVTFCRESHPDVRAGVVAAPSRTAIMAVDEFVARLHHGRGGRAPLLYGSGERCYLQALAPYAMMRQVDFSFLPSDAAGSASAARAPGAAPGLVGRLLRRTRRPPPPLLGRLWVSAPGTVSPLHYDATDSYLCQVRGVKRMLLWPAAHLQALQPYPDDSPLARRLRVDITGAAPPAGQLSDAALAAVASSPLEAVLHPGDVLYFPKEWAHHTEALPPGRDEEPAEPPQPSFSLAFRSDGQFLL